MSILLIGSGLVALGGLGAGLVFRRLRRGPRIAEQGPGPSAEHGANACPVCLARDGSEAKISSKTGL